jgi:hypothetical protein
VKYTGNGTAGATIGHGLSSTPEMVIVKCISGTDSGSTSWHVYTPTTGATKTIRLNATSAASTNSLIWNNTAPTSTVFSVSNNTETNGPSGQQYIAYCFHSVDGYQKVGSYTGTGVANTAIGYTDSNGDGTGTGAFIPRWVMIKRTDAGSSNWFILDSIRDATSPYGAYLLPNAANAENNLDAYSLYFNSNGFTVNSTDVQLNALNGTYIYLAIA